MEHDCVCITGGTGFVGSHLALDLLKHTSYSIIALVRGEPEKSAARLREALLLAARERGDLETLEACWDRIHCEAADIALPGCGVSEPSTRRLWGRVRCVFHLAACLKFEDADREEIRRLNVTGTHHVLSLAESLRAERFVYMSTAYVCGDTTGVVPEALFDRRQEFRNEYERSKCDAEHLVAERCADIGMAYTIVRPSIVVGPRSTYKPAGSDSGLYGFIREVHRLRKTLRNAPMALKLPGDASAALNLVPVDEVTGATVELMRQGFPGTIHHLTSDDSPSVGTTLTTISQLCGVPEITVIAQQEQPLSPIDEVFSRRARFYKSYLKGHKQFARAWGNPIRVSDSELRHYVAEFVRERERSTAGQVFHTQTLRATDGHTLETFACGDRSAPPILLVNALGMPMDFWVPLAKHLIKTHYVVGWTLRDHNSQAPSSKTHFAAHLADISSVLDFYELPKACLVGWCTGSDLALAYAAAHPERVSGTASINGALLASSALRTAFQSNIARIALAASADPERSRICYELIYEANANSVGYPELNVAQEQSDLTSILSAIDISAMDLASAPFRSAERFHQYACALADYFTWSAVTPLPKRLASPVLVIAATNDLVVHCDVSRRFARQLGAAELVIQNGTHFVHFYDCQVMNRIGAFAEEVACRQARGKRPWPHSFSMIKSLTLPAHPS